MVATENSIHAFERAGLGKAPFRIIGVCDKVGPIQYHDPKMGGVLVTIGAPGQPMGCCKFCGQGIMECWSIKSADGRVFDVGCDCVRKAGDAGMKKVIDAHKAKISREKRHAKGVADRAYVDSVIADDSAVARLAKMKHPNADRPWFANATGSDYVTYMRKNCGDAGMSRLAKWCREALK